MGAESCDAELSTLMIPDAELRETGATLPGCVSCVKTNCSNQIAACNADCTCSDVLVGVVNCLEGGTSIGECGVALIGPSMASGAVWACLDQNCLSRCGGPKL
jgi:hypothetical protein